MNFVDYTNREEWLKSRVNSLGASEISCVLGCGFQSALELWKIKTNKIVSNDLSKNKRVEYGTKAEEYLRLLFALKNAYKYKVEYFPYRVYQNEKYGYLTATLDGELTTIADNKKGVWECKTVWITSRKMIEDWNGKIPNKYYIQVCEQLGITGYAFAVVTVELIFSNGDSEIRNYTIERNEQVERDIQFVEKEAVRFWTEYVIPKKKPPVRLTI